MVRGTTLFPRRACLVVAVALPVLLASSAQAVFVKVGGNEAACSFNTQYTFAFANNAPFNDLKTWDVALNGPLAAGKVNLSVRLQHTTGIPNCDPGHGFNAASQTFNFVVAAPAAGKVNVSTNAALIDHGPHADVYRATVTAVGPVAANPASGALTTAGEHTKGKSLTASIENTGTKTLKNVTVTPSYFNPATGLTTDGDPIKRPDLKPGATDKLDLPKSGKLLPTNYKITASGSPTTETTLAFLGTWNGAPAELPLGDFAELFMGTSEFFLPMLRASDDLTNLFVAVDLTQWLGDPRTFTAGMTYSFIGGLSDDLPGFLVGTSPITFDSASGSFMTASPYDGNAFAAATIDGSVIPEPASMAFLLSGLALFAGVHMKRRRN